MAVFIQKKGRGRPVSWVVGCIAPLPSHLTPHFSFKLEEPCQTGVHGARSCIPCNPILSFKGIFYLWDYCNSSYKRYIDIHNK